MQAANHVHFCDPETQGFGNYVNYFLDRPLKSVGIAFFGSEGAKLAGEHTNIGIIDVTIDDIAGVVAVLLLAHRAGHDPERVEIVASIQIERVSLRNALPRLDFLRNRPKITWNKYVFHPQPRLENIVIMHTRLLTCTKKRRSVHPSGSSLTSVTLPICSWEG